MRSCVKKMNLFSENQISILPLNIFTKMEARVLDSKLPHSMRRWGYLRNCPGAHASNQEDHWLHIPEPEHVHLLAPTFDCVVDSL